MSLDEMDKARTLTVQMSLLLGLASISIVGGRFCMRWWQVGLKNLGLDDYLPVAGGILFVPNVVLAYLMNTQTHWVGNQSVLSNDPVATQPSGSEDQLRELGSKLYLYNWLCFSTALWTLKAAFLANILRQTTKYGRRQIHQYLGFGLLAVTWAASTMAFLQSCGPLSHTWQVYPDLGRSCQPAMSPVLVWVYFGFDMATNLYLALTAVSVAAGGSATTLDKLQWLGTLVCGLLVTAAAVARAVILVSAHNASTWQTAETWALWQIFFLICAVTSTEYYPRIREGDDTDFNNFIYSTRFSDRKNSLAESEATIVVSPSVTDLYNKFAEPSLGEIRSEERRNSGIQRKVEVSVFQEAFEIAPEGPCDICGNYTRGWANDDGANKPEQRSSYFGGPIHFHVPNYGSDNKELHDLAF
ncbi:pth11-typeg- -coupled receptor [Trichoderma arundinaceum]|uniref:Pth11-typeg--coupled receptor n=1 Tax=Trichoderma arundinaceum TaxID=490622 RepID=A0A395NIW8_TRIAR|nr:pth11-typeg- -coupled receptor [Trichoderma arundinaceum]